MGGIIQDILGTLRDQFSIGPLSRRAVLDATLLTAPRIAKVQDSSGTLAYLADIAELQQQVNRNSGGAAPAGVVLSFAGGAVPAGYLLCDNAEYAIADYPKLYDAIGTRWGGNGSSTFRVPPSDERFQLGTTTPSKVGQTGGSNTLTPHTHTVAGTAASAGAHNHGEATGAPSAATATSLPVGVAAVPTSTHTHTISADGAHTHGLTITAQPTDGSQDSKPAYLRTLFIISNGLSPAGLDTDLVSEGVQNLYFTDARAAAAAAPATAAADAKAQSALGITHDQLSASDTWTINHNLGRKPAVAVYSLGGVEMFADVVHASINQALIYFAQPYAGYARLV